MRNSITALATTLGLLAATLGGADARIAKPPSCPAYACRCIPAAHMRKHSHIYHRQALVRSQTPRIFPSPHPAPVEPDWTVQYGQDPNPRRPCFSPDDCDRKAYDQSGTRGRMGLGADPAHPEGPGNFSN
jgi:hypothetical protein